MIPSVVMGLTSKFKRLGLFMSTTYVADEMNFLADNYYSEQKVSSE